MKKIIAIGTTLTFLVSAVPAFASHWSSNDIDIEVKNKDTTVINTVNTSASTGGNQANGGSGGGNGGVILTGNAWATSGVLNDVNSTVVKVKTDCGCKGDVDVKVENKDTTVTNNVTTKAKTGYNDANGGSGSHHHHGGSNGGDGGTIVTGDADALATVVNVVNSTVVRVRR